VVIGKNLSQMSLEGQGESFYHGHLITCLPLFGSLECSWRRLLAEGMGVVLHSLVREPSSG